LAVFSHVKIIVILHVPITIFLLVEIPIKHSSLYNNKLFSHVPGGCWLINFSRASQAACLAHEGIQLKHARAATHRKRSNMKIKINENGKINVFKRFYLTFIRSKSRNYRIHKILCTQPKRPLIYS